MGLGLGVGVRVRVRVRVISKLTCGACTVACCSTSDHLAEVAAACRGVSSRRLRPASSSAASASARAASYSSCSSSACVMAA